VRWPPGSRTATCDGTPAGTRISEPNAQLTGGDGGHDINAYALARQGVVLLGRLKGIDNGRLTLGDDLAVNLARGDEQARQFLQTIDAHVVAQGLEAPAEA
jgi:putative flavoprotein involved in K+ transport